MFFAVVVAVLFFFFFNIFGFIISSIPCPVLRTLLDYCIFQNEMEFPNKLYIESWLRVEKQINIGIITAVWTLKDNC